MKLPRWLIALALLACALAWWWNLPPPEPFHQGKPLSQWMKERAFARIDKIDPAPKPLFPAGPPEVKWLAYIAEHGRSPDHELGVVQRLLGKLRRPGQEPPWTGAFDERLNAIGILSDLGPAARPAIPALVRVLNGDTYGHVYSAAAALHQIGPDSWPLVDEQLEHGSNLARCGLLRTMWQRLGSGSEDEFGKVFSRLEDALHDPEPNIRRNAASSLKSAISFAVEHSIRGMSLEKAAATVWLLPDESNREVREAKTAVLSYYKSAEAEAIPHLTTLLADPDVAKRNFARSVLEQLATPESNVEVP